MFTYCYGINHTVSNLIQTRENPRINSHPSADHIHPPGVHIPQLGALLAGHTTQHLGGTLNSLKRQ